MTLRTSSTFSKMKAMLDEAASSDNAPMSALTKGDIGLFDTPAIVQTMQKALGHAFLPDLHVLQWQRFRENVESDDAKSLQRQVVSYLQGVVHPLCPAEFMSRRMRRWLPEVSDEAKQWWSFCGAYLCMCELEDAPKCVVAACLKTALKDWAYARRCGRDQLRCHFGCDSKLDAIELNLNAIELMLFGSISSVVSGAPSSPD
jgi:hypothetical protein